VIAMERFPGEPDGFGLFGRVATLRNDWTEAGRRWGLARERFPQDPGIMAGEREYLIRAASAVPKEHPVPSLSQVMLPSGLCAGDRPAAAPAIDAAMRPTGRER